jgi:broad specificity phosphatase PhoE
MLRFLSTTYPGVRRLIWLLPILLLLGACTKAVRGGKAQVLPYTTVYVVRHAEKETTPGLTDPSLTPAGQERALALRDILGTNQPLSAIFTTNTVRTRATVEPLAAAHQLTPEVYDPKQLPRLVARIRQLPAGQRVLVVGHSNTILETVEALGAPRPVAAIGDNEYDYLLEVKVPRDSAQAATAVARRYGVKSASQ